ncbi:MAG: tetratricopeptide repeat protein [Duncaniella sp.]|uniref:ATP-binding protein n=1 Tax=Duncaniella sp. TaxID=2518496 RepID=UPI0023C77843|nr:tetratricopeptide repeat-containing sensor histidine kinase [Duncaniella sp.]MDE5989463.1 tetratricopeptide repeat protein [Duncaniella sp.]
MYILTLLLASIPLHASTPIDENAIQRIDSYVNTDPDSAIILCNEALAQLSDRTTAPKVSLLSIRGNALFTLGDNTAAIADFSAAVRSAEEIADTMACVNALSDLGVAYRVNQQSDSALICYNRALALLEKSDAPDLEASILTSIAVLFANQGRFEEAVTFAEKGLDKARLTDDIETQIYAASSLGSALFLAGHHDRGLQTQRNIIGIAEKKGIPRYMLKTYASIIAMHNRLGHPDSVRYYIDRGRAVLDKVPEASIESIGFLEQSFVILTAMGRYRESLDIQKKILDMQDSRPFMPLDRLWQRIALNYKGLGDIENMDNAYMTAIAIADSIHQSDINEQISDLNVRYHTAEKELAIASLQAEKSRRDTIIAIIIAGVIIASLLLTIYLRARRRKIEIENIRARLDGIEQERGRLAHELHDGVCNDLLGIELILASGRCDTKELSKMIRTTRNEVRSISHELLPPRFNGLSLTQLIAAYAQKSEGFVSYLTEESTIDLDPEKSINLYRIIQEWTGNLRNHSSATGATVSLTESEGEITLDISDNGSPFDPTAVTSGGLGLENLKRRVKALQGSLNFFEKSGSNHMSVKFFK